VTGTSNSRRADYETALHLIESGKIDSASLVSQRFGISQVNEAIAKVGDPDVLNVALVPDARAARPPAE
jgi:L-iditol 2-dehydrogenase